MDVLPEDIRKAVGNNSLESIALEVIYKNYKGEVAQRKIFPLRIYHGSHQYHPAPQWLMDVWDVDKKDYRTYAFAGIQQWINVPVAKNPS